MNPTLKKAAVPLLRWTVGLVVLMESIETAFDSAAIQHFTGAGLPRWGLMILSSSEIAAAIFFMVPVTAVAGGYALLVILGLAAALHILHGQYNVGALLVYGAAVLASTADREAGTPEVTHDGR